MSIKTDSTPLEEPKNWGNCNCFALYSLLANTEEVAAMKLNYEAGNYGYGDAKQALFLLIMQRFDAERTRYNHYMANLNELEDVLKAGAKKARIVADEVLGRVRLKVGY